jgi:hypothetical protein
MKAFLVATAQNQAPYFLEWVAHHLEVGFTDIVIYQNDSDDLTHETLSTLRDIGAIQYFYNRAPKPVRRQHAYTRAAKLAEFHASDWAIALDLDEFLVVNTGGGTLTDLQTALPDADCIGINRRNFGNSGYEILTNQLVLERFSMAEKPKLNAIRKTLFRPAKVAQPSIYGPQHTGESVSPKAAQINHYATRDIASFLMKSAHRCPAAAARYWTLRNTNTEIDNSTRPFLARVAVRMDALNDASRGQLMDLREAAIFAHMARYYTALQDIETRQLRRFCKGQEVAHLLTAKVGHAGLATPMSRRKKRATIAVEKATT